MDFCDITMCLHPDTQAKAQAEIDSVIGSYRLPGVEDRNSLPYVEAVMKELLRWAPVAPQGGSSVRKYVVIALIATVS